MELVFDQITNAASCYPDNEALVCGDDRLSYRELERRSDSLAVFLKQKGFKRGNRACLSMSKSNDYVVALLAILKAGGVYVPIDHEYPAYRVSQIVTECEPTAFFCDASRFQELEAIMAGAPSLASIFVLSLENDVLLENTSAFNYNDVVSVDREYIRDHSIIQSDLAYILYTSGSTGHPKGVMLSHGNLISFLAWCNKEFAIGPSDRVLQTSPFTFDISGLDMYASLTKGATCVLVVDQRVINMVLRTMDKEQITFVSTVPTVIGAMVENPRIFERYNLKSIRVFCTGSAVIPPVFIEKLSKQLPNAQLYNLYGPTESTIYCLYHKVDRKNIDTDKSIPIGIPFENTNAFVLNDKHQKCAPNESGQLVLRGPYIAKGYYKNEKKTKEQFKQHPLLPHLNETVYYTGDVAHQDEHGVFHFSGRNDDLIKSRGYRIELNEIEIALGGLTHVLREFAAVALPDPLIENKLFAAIVFRDGKSMTIDEIKDFCKTKIPSYMIPDEFVVFDALPQTSSGKVSRKLIKKQLETAKPE